MEAPLFMKCEPGWPSAGEESSNVEQLPFVKYEGMRVKPSIEEGISVFLKEEPLTQDVKREPDHEDYNSAGQLHSQMQPFLHTTTNDDSLIIKPHESQKKQIFSGECNSDSSYFETDVSNIVEKEKWTCKCCSKSFRTELLLEKHVVLHGKDAQISTPWISAVESVSNAENTSSCDGCGKMLVLQCLSEFKDTNLFLCLQCHSRVTSRCTELYICHYCDDKFPYRASLTRHMQIHTGLKLFSCIHCKSTFSDFVNLHRHESMHKQESVHIREEAYICTFCDEKFTCKNSLITHLDVHMGAEPYKCTACGKSFSARWLLRRHAALHKEKSFTCFTCRKSFLRKSDLIRHNATHTGEKAFTCNYCSRAFARKCSLEIHILTHTKEKPHCCSVCAKAFSSRSKLKKHMEVHAV